MIYTRINRLCRILLYMSVYVYIIPMVILLCIKGGNSMANKNNEKKKKSDETTVRVTSEVKSTIDEAAKQLGMTQGNAINEFYQTWKRVKYMETSIQEVNLEPLSRLQREIEHLFLAMAVGADGRINEEVDKAFEAERGYKEILFKQTEQEKQFKTDIKAKENELKEAVSTIAELTEEKENLSSALRDKERIISSFEADNVILKERLEKLQQLEEINVQLQKENAEQKKKIAELEPTVKKYNELLLETKKLNAGYVDLEKKLKTAEESVKEAKRKGEQDVLNERDIQREERLRLSKEESEKRDKLRDTLEAKFEAQLKELKEQHEKEQKETRNRYEDEISRLHNELQIVTMIGDLENQQLFNKNLSEEQQKKFNEKLEKQKKEAAEKQKQLLAELEKQQQINKDLNEQHQKELVELLEKQEQNQKDKSNLEKKRNPQPVRS